MEGKIEMGELCVSLNAVKPDFIPAAKALDKNGDGMVCESEAPRTSNEDFEAFVNTIRNTPDIKEVPAIKIPKMIAVSGKLSIMKGEVTVGLFKQVMQGYEFAGHDADKLKAILNDPSKAGEALTYVSLNDAREFARRLKGRTGRNFRVQTEAEWLTARKRLSGSNWTWTETEYRNTFVLRHLRNGGSRYRGQPGSRYVGSAIRLVEDK